MKKYVGKFHGRFRTPCGDIVIEDAVIYAVDF